MTSEQLSALEKLKVREGEKKREEGREGERGRKRGREGEGRERDRGKEIE